MPTNKKSQTESFKILYFGDSHSVMTMGKQLLEFFPKIFSDFENQSFFYAVSGSTFKDWLSGDVEKLQIKNLSKIPGQSYKEGQEPISLKMMEEVERTKPDILFLALGTNDLLKESSNWQNYLAFIRQNLEKLYLQYHMQIVWIMPPELSPEVLTGHYRSELLKMLSGLKFIEIINVEKIIPDQQDKIHFNKLKATEFAQEVFMQLEAIFPHH